jgi:hypothetical protein
MKSTEWAYYEAGRTDGDPENNTDGRASDYPQGFLTNGMSNPAMHAPPSKRTAACSLIFVSAVLALVALLGLVGLAIVTGATP